MKYRMPEPASLSHSCPPHTCPRSCHWVLLWAEVDSVLSIIHPLRNSSVGFLGTADQFCIEYNGNYVNLTAQNISNANAAVFSHSQKCPFCITSFEYPSIINVPEVCSWMSLYWVRILILFQRQRKRQFLEINIYGIRKTLNEFLLLTKRKDYSDPKNLSF